jgi:two-component system, LytTR family, sensor kinase
LARSPISVSRFRNNFFGWWIIWASLHALLVMSYGYSLNVSATDSLITNGLVMGACWIISNILRYYLPYSNRYWYVLVLSFSFSIAAIVLSKLLLNLVLIDPVYKDYILFLSNTYWLRVGVAFLLVACMAIICVLWYTQEEEQENRQRKNDAEKLSRDAELYKLRQQLQPHFLFNSLNSISALIGSDPSQARKMIHQLSDFLRTTLRKDEEQWVKMEEELES